MFKSENYVMEIFNVLSKKESLNILKKYNKNLKKSLYYNFKNIDISKFKYLGKLEKCINFYKKEYPEIDLTASKWKLASLRFKGFLKGQSFDSWHSEQCMSALDRMLALQLYLTDHNCGTQFFSQQVIKSEVGKVLLFPAYFTHTHRGQPCPEQKNRYIITGYFNFYAPGKKEIDRRNV